jgi:hypothetical protein
MTKEPKKPREPKPDKPKSEKAPRKSGGNPRAKPGSNLTNLTDDEVRALFLSNRGEYVAAKAKLDAAKKVVDDAVTQAKSDGFTKKELDLSIQLSDLKGEKKVIADVETRLRVARWIGHKMGAQMDLFAEPDRTPSVDKAFDEGKVASMSGKPRKPPYAPGLPQEASWYAGFDKDQERLQASVGRGNATPPAPGGAGTATEPPTSGMRMSRADYQAEQIKARAAREAAESSAPDSGDDDAGLSIQDEEPRPAVH